MQLNNVRIFLHPQILREINSKELSKWQFQPSLNLDAPNIDFTQNLSEQFRLVVVPCPKKLNFFQLQQSVEPPKQASVEKTVSFWKDYKLPRDLGLLLTLVRLQPSKQTFSAFLSLCFQCHFFCNRHTMYLVNALEIFADSSQHASLSPRVFCIIQMVQRSVQKKSRKERRKKLMINTSDILGMVREDCRA